jgi:FkbM family methyltransferase
VGYTGTIFSFEPGPAAFSKLASLAAQDPDWHAFNYALGDETGTMELNIMHGDEFSSFYEPAASMEAVSDAAARNNHVVRRVPVKVRKLNDVIEELKNEVAADRFYLKLDTQGFDLAVMRGANTVLPQICAMQSEIPMLKLYHGAPGYDEALRFYREQGFDVTGFFSVNRDDSLRIIDVDCVMINRAWVTPRAS